ncbi:ATP-binding protein [Granulicella arctica]|uniref:ATP-binding protein n=1 Tax=Granulicella arctica TaxID=940613 RepID=UPI0021DF584D|nr:ATP-binding protein [Granulicella arctica]
MKIFRPANIRTRLAVWFIAILAAILTIYIAVVFSFQYFLLERQIFHDEIQDVETVEGLLYFDATGVLHLQDNYHSRPQSHLLEDRLMEVRDQSGVILYRSKTLGDMILGGVTLPDEGATSYNQRSIRIADGTHVLLISHLHPVQNKLVLIRLGYSLEPLHDRMLRFFFLLLLATPIALILAGFAGYSIARRALRPLDLMAARAEQITAIRLHDRVTVENPHDELGHMARVLNHLLDRIEQAFLQLQRFTADAAHELRTPLASVRALGEASLLEDLSAAEYRDTIGSMLEETIRLNQTIDGLLLLAKTELGQAADQQRPFSLPELLAEIITLLDVLLEERHLAVMQEGAAALVEDIVADRSLVRVAFLNVLHNAIKFTAGGSKLHVFYSRQEREEGIFQKVCIHDSGPGILPAERERVFDRFFTSDSASTSNRSGAGLGLSIAKLIVDRSGGQIFFEDSKIEQGANCCIELPVVRSAILIPSQ